MAIPLFQRGPRADWEGGGILWPRTLKNATPYVTRLAERGLPVSETSTPLARWNRPPAQFRAYLNDPDLAPIRETPEFQQFLKELDPVFPGPRPAP